MSLFGRDNLDLTPAEHGSVIAKRLLLKVEAVAELCGVSTRTVYRWLNREGLPVHRIPGAGLRPILRISQADLDAWLSRHRHDPEVEADKPKRTMRLEGMRFMRTSSAADKIQLDTSRRFRPRVSQKG
jgi:excisionase family DNA binding protein